MGPRRRLAQQVAWAIRHPRGLAITLVAVILCSVLIGQVALQQALRASLADDLQRTADSLAAELTARFERLEDLGIDLMLALGDPVAHDPESFAALVERYRIEERFPEVAAVGVAELVERDALDEWLATQAAQGGPSEVFLDAGEPVLRLLRFVHPPDPARGFAGGDLSSLPVSREAFDLATQSGTPVLSRPTGNLDDPEQRIGAALHVPVITQAGGRPTTLGLVLSVPAVLAGLEPLPTAVEVTLREAGDASVPVARIGDERSTSRLLPDAAETREVGIGERWWVIEVWAAEGFVPPPLQRPTSVLGITGVVTLLLAGFVAHVLASDHVRVSAQVDARTEELREANLQLGESNLQLEAANVRFERTNLDLLAADRMKDDFLAAVSHELRTPLTVIGGLTETFQRLPWDQRSGSELIDAMQRNVRRLDVLISDLLLLVELDAGRLQPRREPVRVRKATQAVIAELSAGRLTPSAGRLTPSAGRLAASASRLAPSASRDATAGSSPGDAVAGAVTAAADQEGLPEQEGPTVSIDPHLRVHVDPRHLGRMLDNLIVNALRHGQPPVHVSARVDGNRVSIEVHDGGVGLDGDDHDEVFARFARGKDADRSTGTGLGLAIVRELAALNDGAVRYVAVDSGSCFVLELPLASQPADTPPAAAPGQAAGHPALLSAPDVSG